MVIDTGRSYERSAILNWFGRGRLTDPLTNEELATTRLVPNINLRLLIEGLPEERVRAQQRKTLDFENAIKILEEAWGPPQIYKKHRNQEEELLAKIHSLEDQLNQLKDHQSPKIPDIKY